MPKFNGAKIFARRRPQMIKFAQIVQTKGGCGIMRLEAVREIEQEILTTKTELENLREVVPTSRLDGAPHGKATASPVERTAIKIETLERRLDELAGQYAATSMELAMEIFRRVTGKAQQVLFLRYCFGKTPSEIAAELKISRSYLSRLHTQGRQEFSAASPTRGE